MMMSDELLKNALEEESEKNVKPSVRRCVKKSIATEDDATSLAEAPKKVVRRKKIVPQENGSPLDESSFSDAAEAPKVIRTQVKRSSQRRGDVENESFTRDREERRVPLTNVRTERVASLLDDTPVEALPQRSLAREPREGREGRERSAQEPRYQKQRRDNRLVAPARGKNAFRQESQQGGRVRFENRRAQQGSRDARSSGRDYVPEGGALKITGTPYEVSGLLEMTPKGFGFLRTSETNFEQTTGGVYVSQEIIRKNALRPCQWLEGMAHETNRGIQFCELIAVNGASPEEAKRLPYFDELKAVNPDKRITLETTADRYTTRVVDMMAPIGRGQRGLIVAPPRTGKTVLLQHMAEAIVENYEGELHLMILLIDERPEEVTEFKRGIQGAEVYASSNDGRVRDHCRLAELCIERAKRLVESGKHVFLLMDSITRLARAYNNAQSGNGRTMSGGIDAKALEMPRRLFAAARNTREAGSLTIVATALIETNSRMDDLIFQEFKGTGNMELVLSRRVAEQYIYPAVDILKSGTRREELVLPELILDKVQLIRRALAGHKPIEAMERLLFFLRKYSNNTQMLIDLKQRV